MAGRRCVEICQIVRYHPHTFRDRLKVGLQVLVLAIGVRILVPEPQTLQNRRVLACAGVPTHPILERLYISGLILASLKKSCMMSANDI